MYVLFVCSCVCSLIENSFNNESFDETPSNALNRTYSKDDNQKLQEEIQKINAAHQQQQNTRRKAVVVDSDIRSYRAKPKLTTIVSVAMPAIVPSIGSNDIEEKLRGLNTDMSNIDENNTSSSSCCSNIINNSSNQNGKALRILFLL